MIAGTARSMPLKTIEGRELRPTTDRIKETLFNILQGETGGCKFLDLFAGSGAIGIEALSRGAKISYFAENNREAAACIRENLSFTRLADRGVVMECDAVTAIRRLAGKEVFDIVFMDPPYNWGGEKEVLMALKESKIVDSVTWIIVEAQLKRDFFEAEELGFRIVREKKYKTNKHVFLRLE